MKVIYIFILSLLMPMMAGAQTTNVFDMLSPKLQHFLVEHKTASQSIDKVLLEAFANRTLQVYYFYSSNENLPKAYHFYPATNTVVIAIRENQFPMDEFSSLLFEEYNSEHEAGFEEQIQKAASRSVSKADFARNMMRLEFDAVMKTKKVLRSFILSKPEQLESAEYTKFINCPESYKEYLAYLPKVSKRNAMLEYEEKYELLAGQSPDVKAKTER